MPLFDAITRVAIILAFEFLFVFIIGHAGLLNPAILGISVFATLGALVYTAISRTHEFLEESRVRGPGFVTGFSATEAVLVVLCIVAALSSLPLALTPPTVRDELIQHLTMPRLYLERGAIYETPFMGFSYLPGNAGLLYLATMAFGSDIIPRVVHWGFGILTGLLIYGYLSHRAGRVAALLGFLFFISTPVVLNLSRMAYIDLASTFFATLSILSALFWKDGFKPRWLVVSAVGMGLALGTKYSTIPAFVLIGCFVPYIYFRKTGKAAGALKSAVIFGVVAIAVLSPWLIRNWIWAGNPLYPLVQFAAASTAAGGDGVHVTGGLSPIAKRILLYGEGVIGVLLVPLRIFWEGADNTIERFDGVLNVLFLPLLFIGLVRRRMLDAGYLAIFALLVCFISMLTVDVVIRYLLPAVVAVVVVSASAAAGLLRDPIERRTWVRVVGGVLVAVFLVINAVYLGKLYAAYRPWGFLIGSESRDAYLARVVPDYAAITEANRVLPGDARVYMLFSGERTYYWDRDFYYGDRLGGQFKAMVLKSVDADGLVGELSELGVTHIFTKVDLLERFINDNFEGARLGMLAEFFNEHTRRVVYSGGFAVFEIS